MNTVGFFKRLIVIIYDGFLLVGVIMVGYGLLFLLLSALPLPTGFDTSITAKIVKVSYLLIVSFSFYGWFWTHGGQTLGMKVWNLYLVDQHGKFIGWRQSVARYLAALLSWALVAGVLQAADIERWYLALGLGFTWSLVHKRNLTWHDLLTGTRIVQIPKTSTTK